LYSGRHADGDPLGDLQDVRPEIAAGSTREQAMDDVKDGEYMNYPGGAARLRPNVGIIYDQLKFAR
jgi:hypothetical protein